MTSKQDSVSTLGYHWTDHTGRPLEPQVHWDATGTTLADASTQWCSSGDPVLICIIGTHWKTTGKPLEDHWKHTGNTLATNIFSPVAFQCTLVSKFQAHWIATGLPLEDHWLRVRELSTSGVWRYVQHLIKYAGSVGNTSLRRVYPMEYIVNIRCMFWESPIEYIPWVPFTNREELN